ncbi:MAG: winged helix-turn-helix transcriptional regulator, partial [Lachnospiraceae bacterium]|nr:winged helix-turn-helix transcriptional regulator [Lachnospiraceae bacterium]
MRFEKIKAPSQKEMFVKKIQEMILSGDLPAGTYLPPERDLSEQMGVSRTVVTTGIAILESQGFIKVIPRQGNVVEDIRMNGTVETLNAMLKLKGDILTDNDIR